MLRTVQAMENSVSKFVSIGQNFVNCCIIMLCYPPEARTTFAATFVSIQNKIYRILVLLLSTGQQRYNFITSQQAQNITEIVGEAPMLSHHDVQQGIIVHIPF